MTWWHAAFVALLWNALPAGAAEDVNGAARELARRTVAAAGTGEPVSVAWQNFSSLGPAAQAQARAAFDTALRDAGGRKGEPPSAEVRIALSETPDSGLLVEEFRKGDTRQVWIVPWSRSSVSGGRPALTLSKRLVWEQDAPILDVAAVGDSLLVLTPEALVRTSPRETVRISASRPWPRDVRGHVRVIHSTVEVNLPGVLCSGDLEPALTLSCAPSDEPWTLESGRALILAHYAADRNYFDGNVVTQAGVKKAVPPFYAAAATEEQGRTLWLLSQVDGRTGIFDASMEPVGSIASWGSEIAWTDARCGQGPVTLAAAPGEGPDSLQAYGLANRAAIPLGEPLEFSGPLTALWPGMAVARNAATGKRQAYAVSVACAP